VKLEGVLVLIFYVTIETGWIKDMKNSFYVNYIKKLLFLLDKEKIKLIPMFFLFILSSLLDIVGIGLIAPYVSIIVSPDAINKESISVMVDLFNLPRNTDYLVKFISYALLLVFIVKAAVSIFINWFIISFGHNQQLRIRKLLIKAFQNIIYEDFVKRNSSEFIVLISQFTGNFSTVLQTFLKFTSEIFVTLAIIIILFSINSQVLMLLIIIFGITIFLYNTFYKNKIVVYGKESNKASRLMLQGLNENVKGLKDIRILRKESFFYNKVANNAAKVAKKNTYANVINMIPRILIEFISIFFIVSTVLLSLFFEYSLEDLAPTLAVFGVASLRLMPSANILSSSLIQFRFHKDSIDKLYDEILYSERYKRKTKNLVNHSKFESFKKLTVENIGFKYSKDEKGVLNNISFELNKSECIGITGASGSGKTTLMDLILGLIKPTYGQVLYNGTPIENNISLWMSQVAYLPQQVFLIDDSLRKNIALGEDEDQINEKMIIEAIKKSRLSDFVDNLPDSYNTLVGESGIRLSGGQRQRIALARAFYYRKSVIVMDESTSSLDTEVEKEILDEIRMLKGDSTIIVIAHRESVLKLCDKIYKIQDGNISQK
jgi:ATP-binding cassette, subfamily B, bacterial PglK